MKLFSLDGMLSFQRHIFRMRVMRSLMAKALFVVGLFFSLTGCNMFSAWRTIPPPGGCDQCHTVPISNDWKVAYQAPILTDERGHEYFQTEQYNMPRTDKPESELEIRKVGELQCFACHRSPSAAHKARKGRFHH